MLAVCCGVLTAAPPYACDLLALRRVSAHVFSTLTGVDPVIAASVGWLVLGQALGAAEWTGIALIVVSHTNITSTALHRRRVAR